MTRPATFTKADVTRASSGVLAAGLGISQITIDRSGNIVIIPAQSGEPSRKDDNEWEDLE